MRKEISDTNPQDCICGTLPAVEVFLTKSRQPKYQVQCHSCHRCAKAMKTESKAIKEWNKDKDEFISGLAKYSYTELENFKLLHGRETSGENRLEDKKKMENILSRNKMEGEVVKNGNSKMSLWKRAIGYCTNRLRRRE